MIADQPTASTLCLCKSLENITFYGNISNAIINYNVVKSTKRRELGHKGSVMKLIIMSKLHALLA